MKTKAVYPGTFDPVTYGHLDIMRRAIKLFGTLIVAVGRSSAKEPTFTVEERVRLLKASLKEVGLDSSVRVDIFEGLLVDYLLALNCRIVVRGLRFLSDFEYEFQMALMNRHLWPKMETVFLMPDEKHAYISSSLIKEIARGGKDTSPFVPRCVAQALKHKIPC